jgi:hypothetical protein
MFVTPCTTKIPGVLEVKSNIACFPCGKHPTSTRPPAPQKTGLVVLWTKEILSASCSWQFTYDVILCSGFFSRLRMMIQGFACRILPSYDYQVRWYFIDKVHTYVYSVTIGSKSQSIEYLLPDGEMSTRQEVGVINVKYHCHKVTGTLSSKSPSVAYAIVAPVDSKLYPDLCITRDCFLILMLRTF